MREVDEKQEISLLWPYVCIKFYSYGRIDTNENNMKIG